MKSCLKIFVILSILMGIVHCSSFAQKGKTIKPADSTIISQENVPAEVAKAFKKRFATATDVVWRSVEGNFVAECMSRSIPTETKFKKDGTWLSTTEELDPNTLPSACIKSINAYFQKCTFVSYKRVTESNKDITLIVGIYETQNVKKKLETKILLDKVGAIIRTIEPEEPTEATASDTENAVDKKKAKQEAKAEKELDRDKNKDNHPVKILESELPYSLLQWISRRYPEYVYREILYTEDPDFEDEGNLYRIKIQRSGVGQAASATVWFTRDGDFLKVDDPFRTEEELQKAEQDALAKEKANTSQNEDDAKAKKAKTKTEQTPERIIIEEDEVPAEYRAAMKLKYPRMKEVTWSEDEDGKWIALYTDLNGKNEVLFEKTDSIRWVETKTPISDFNRVPFAARSYIEKNYPKQVAIKQAWSVKSAKVKPYIIVELYNKKDKSTEILGFWQTGKLK